MPRSLASVVMVARQPPLTSPTTLAAGILTSVRNTSLNVAPPVIWRSGRTSIPGCRMSTMKKVIPRCLGRSWIGAGQQDPHVGVVGARAPHLLAVDHPLVAVALGPGRQAGQVGAGARLAEQLAPHLVAPQHGGRYRARCSSVPWPMMVGPAIPMADGEQARGDVETAPPPGGRSSPATKVPPRPPNSTGQVMPAQPPS